MTDSDYEKIEIMMLRRPTEQQIGQIVDLYRAQGWWGDEDAKNRAGYLLPQLIEGSHCFVVALKSGEIVGMGRAISDGISDAYIQDLTVHGDHQKKGIGKRILLAILEQLHKDGIHWIGLIAQPGSDNLYRRAGFREMKAWVPMLKNDRP
jgi:aralkylamine N-acetyltransferase